MYDLIEPTSGKRLNVAHFPTKYQTVIFRLWEMVPYSKIANVIKASDEEVLRSADAMGLCPQKITADWATRGYISIIRAVWNLLPYEQIYSLLDWDSKRLSYVLKEDDFLAVKLGEKCVCQEVTYRELTDTEIEQTANIKKTVLTELRSLMPQEEAKPFDFFNSMYTPIVENKTREVVVDSSWSIESLVGCVEVEEFINDFKAFAKKYSVIFCENSEKKIRLRLDSKSSDEEYHEIKISDELIDINAATPMGILRALYYLEDLVEGAGTFSFDRIACKRKTKVKTRFIYAFSSLYSDVLDKDLSISFPNELLEGYGRRGINGIWIQGILYELAPYPFDPSLSEGWEERLHKLKSLTQRAARYGIKVYIYINEPRNMPLSFFEKYPHLKGATLNEGFACLCTSHPETQEYMKNALQTVCRNVPLVGGFINITQSENLVLCCSNGMHVTEESKCPVCSKRKDSEVSAEMLKVMANAVAEVNPNIKFFTFAWAWIQHLGKEETAKLIQLLPDNTILLQVSESQKKFERGGIHSFVRDYSLSIVGPGEPAQEMWQMARDRGLEVAAKIQINNSWECATAPYLPVYDNVIEHMENLLNEGVEHMMLSWTLGGYISDNIKIAASYFFEEEDSSTTETYEQTLSRVYGPYADKVKHAVNHFCRGFGEYPFQVWHIYRGPSNAGVANLLYPEPTGLKATMTCYPYDDVTGWCAGYQDDAREGAPYPPEILKDQYRKVYEEWEKGLELLDGMPVCEFYDMAVYGYTLFRSTYNQISYYLQRDGERNENVIRKLVESEKDLALRAYSVMLRNSAVGFEAANQYYVTRSMLMEKVVQCDYLLSQLS